MASLVPGYASMQISAEFIVPNIGARTTRERPNPSLAQLPERIYAFVSYKITFGPVKLCKFNLLVQ